MNREHIRYTLKHKKAFLETEKYLLGHNTVRGFLHDLDKIFMYLVTSKKHEKKVSRFHRNHSRHHPTKARTKSDYIQMVIDWECGRFTKPDKPMTARQTLFALYPEMKSVIIPILDELNLQK